MRITDDFTHPSGPWHKNTSLVQIKICGRSYGTKIRWSLQSPSYEFVPVDLGWQMSVISPPKFFREHHRVKKKINLHDFMCTYQENSFLVDVQ